MPWYKLGAFGGSGGGSGNIKKSLVLPVNVSTLTVNSTTTDLILTWEIPDQSEMQIEKFNIYYADASTNPTLLSDFTFFTSVNNTATAYTITGLDSSKTYKVVVESVSVEGYENASLKGVATTVLIGDSGYFLVTNQGRLLFSAEGINGWTECILPNDCRACEIYKMDTGRLLILSQDGNVYYSDTGEIWTLALSTDGIEYPEFNLNAITYNHFTLFNNYYYLCVDGNCIYKTQDGINWNKLIFSQYYPGSNIRSIGNYVYRYGGKSYGYKTSLSYSSDLTTWTTCNDGLYSSNPINSYYINDINSLDGQHIYMTVYGYGVYYKVSPSSSAVLLFTGALNAGASNSNVFHKVLCSNKSNTLIISFIDSCGAWSYLKSGTYSEFEHVDYNLNGRLFYDEHKDIYIAFRKDKLYAINASNVTEIHELENTMPPVLFSNENYLFSFIYK